MVVLRRAGGCKCWKSSGTKSNFGEWDAVKRGNQATVLIVGEAGIGKTHLVRAFLQSLEHVEDRVFSGQSSPSHTHTAYYPIAGMFKKFLSGDDGLSLESLENWLTNYSLDLNEAVPLMAGLFSIPFEHKYDQLGLSPKLIAKKTQELVIQLLKEQSKNQASIVILEDLQWADPSTLEVLVACQQTDLNALFVFTSRAEIANEKLKSKLIGLTPLSNSDIVVLAEHLVGGKKLPDKINDQLAKKTGGVPLFIEELVRLILESNI